MQSKQPSVSELMGKVSAQSDMSVVHNRNRYLVTSTVLPNQFFRMVVPRVSPTAMLDCRNIRMRFLLTITSTDANICVDSNFLHPFQRVRILSGSTVLLDINNSSLLMVAQYNARQSSTISAYEQSLIGDGNLAARQGWAAAPLEYLIPLYPENTILRRDGLFDLNSTSDLILEFYTLTANQLLYSPANDTTATYTLSNIEILSQYIQSASLANYFKQNPMAYTCHDYRDRYATITDTLSQVRLSSSSTSLNGFLMLMRNSNVEAAYNQQNKMTVANSNSLVSYNLLVNQTYFFDEPIASFSQFFNELSHFLPEAEKAVYFTSAFTSTRFIVGIRVSAAPEIFREQITSGIRTAALNNDIVLQLTFSAAPGSMQRVDTFLQSDVVVYCDPSTRDVQLKL